MSKDKPEVGDVWIDTETDRFYHVTHIENDIIWFAMIYEYSGIQVFWEKLDMFFQDCKYLGKSKANISDLFKTDKKELEK